MKPVFCLLLARIGHVTCNFQYSYRSPRELFEPFLPLSEISAVT